MAKSYDELLAENEELRRGLNESQELLRAIAGGEVDALVLSGSEGEQVFTLEGADRAYRILIEAMNDGAVTMTSDGTVLYCNHHFAEMTKSPLQKVIGSSIYSFIPQSAQSAFNMLLRSLSRGELTLQAGDGSILPVYISINSLQLSESQKAFCVVFTDLTEQKRNEEIVAAEKLARSIIEQTTEAVIVCDEKGKVIRFSDAVPRILGFDPSLQSFEDLFDLHRPIGGKLSPVLVALRGEVLLQVEVSFKRGDGKLFHLLLNAGPLKSADCRIIGCVVTLADITERKQAEIALQNGKEELEVSAEELRLQNEELISARSALLESETRYKSLVENIPSVLMRYDRDLKVVYLSPQAEKITGIPVDQFIGRTNREVGMPDDLCNLWEAAINRVFQTGENQELEFDFPASDGLRTFYLKLSPELAPKGATVQYVLGISNEITERKRAEEALSKSEAKLRAVFRSLSEGVVFLNPKGEVEEANDAVQRLHGHTLQELTNPKLDPRWQILRSDGTLFPVDEQPAIAALRTGESVRDVEMCVPTSDGKLRWRLVNAQPVYDDHGSLLGAVASFFDITERKKAEEALKKAHDELELRVQERTAELSDAKENLEVINEELQVEISEHEKTERNLIASKEAAEAAVEAKAAFLANMSHELRTPLNAVIGYSSLLLDENLTQEQKENIESIRNGGEALLAIISDILEFSRAEKEKVKLEHQPFSLKRCIEESLDMVAVQAKKKGLNLAYTISYGTPDTIIGDPGRLRQILVNLLSNSVKFTDIGEISVSVSSKVIEGNKRQITFTVRDTGIGMPQDKMDRLFEPFTQLEYVISRKRDGAGLGLAVSRKLVELMGGEIWAESEEGKGSTFRFTIPAEAIPGKQLDLDEKERADYQNLAGQKPLSILVAEDNPSNQKVLVEMLKRLGYRADAVADGVEVLQALRIRPYDLVFMDIKMPEMDGLTAAKEIRKLWPDNGPKIVAITAFAMEGDQEKCLEAGMDGYIAKPVKVNDLATLLRNITPPPRIKFRK